MDRKGKVLLWVAYHLELLKKRGFVEGDTYSISPKGRNAVDILLAQSFQPTEQELDDCLACLCPSQDHMLGKLIKKYFNLYQEA